MFNVTTFPTRSLSTGKNVWSEFILINKIYREIYEGYFYSVI